MNQLISVIIPVYNAEKYLDRCIQSVFNNTYKNLEIILVDDGSTDSSGKICDLYKEDDDRVIVIHKENGGTAAARNDALEIANGDYVAFLDNDDYISPYFYEYMIRATSEIGGGIDIVVCEITREDNPRIFTEQLYGKAVFVDKLKFIMGTYTGNWTRNTTPWNKLYKKELFKNIKFPEGKGYEDAYTTYQLLYQAENIGYLNNVLYCWYKNDDSYSSKQDNARKLLFREEAIRMQSEFYTIDEYVAVKQEAIRFYLNELYFMIWQLDHDYELSKDTIEVRQQFAKRIKREYWKHYKLLSKSERLKIIEYNYPVLGMIYRKLLRRN